MISFSSLQKFIIIYLLVINLITFFIFGLDKLKARVGSRRMRERILWVLAFLGGSVGALLGMQVFRHKTKKLSFQTVLALIILLQVWFVFWLWK